MITSTGSSNICFTDASQLARHGFNRLARLAPRPGSLARVYLSPPAHAFLNEKSFLWRHEEFDPVQVKESRWPLNAFPLEDRATLANKAPPQMANRGSTSNVAVRQRMTLRRLCDGSNRPTRLCDGLPVRATHCARFVSRGSWRALPSGTSSWCRTKFPTGCRGLQIEHGAERRPLSAARALGCVLPTVAFPLASLGGASRPR